MMIHKKNGLTTNVGDSLTIDRADKIRRELSVSQKFMQECLGVNDTAWSYWKQTGNIPREHHSDIIKVFASIRAIKNGKAKDPNREIRDSLSTLTKFLNATVESEQTLSIVNQILTDIDRKL